MSVQVKTPPGLLDLVQVVSIPVLVSLYLLILVDAAVHTVPNFGNAALAWYIFASGHSASYSCSL